MILITPKTQKSSVFTVNTAVFMKYPEVGLMKTRAVGAFTLCVKL